jgi:hypothetical protein
MLERDELAVEAQYRRRSDLQVQVGRLVLKHRAEDVLELQRSA